MSMTNKPQAPARQANIVEWEEFVELTGISPDLLRELVALDWIETGKNAAQVQIFHDEDIYRVRKLSRICCDFELPVVGGAIIVDLLERIDRLENLVRKLNSYK